MARRLLRFVPDWVIGVGALVVAATIVIGAFELRIRYASADALDGFVLVGEDVLVVDRLHSGDGETSLPGGARVLLLDSVTGAVKSRKRVGADHRLVTVAAGAVWLRVRGKSFAAYDVPSFSVHATHDELASRAAELRELNDAGCYDEKSGAWRFTRTDGRFVAFRFADSTVAPADSSSCSSLAAVARTGRLADGRTVWLRSVLSSARSQLVIGEGAKSAPVGELTYLEGQLLLDPQTGRDGRLLTPAPKDVLITRRTGANSTSGTEIARVSLDEKVERWSARLSDRATRVEQAEAHAGGLYLRDASTLTVLDLETGNVRWRYGR